MAKQKIIKFEEIDKFFKNYEFTDDVIELNQCTTILDIKQMVNSHLEIIRNNQGKTVDQRRPLMPYYERLVQVYKLLNLNWDGNN